MPLFAHRFLFLLALLAVDWYFDTSFGHDPFNRPMCSTEAYCESLVHKQHLCDLLAAPCLLGAGSLFEAFDQQLAASGPCGTVLTTPPVLGASLDHVFTSMQC
jgi:hypothetical protein